YCTQTGCKQIPNRSLGSLDVPFKQILEPCNQLWSSQSALLRYLMLL
ncbi:12330_t:CDS:1, partial [Funneliformis mosseae]